MSLTVDTLFTEEVVGSIVKLIRDTKGKQSLIDKLPDVKTLTRQEAINRLKKHYKSEKLVLVLGAGASVDFELPNWNTLLQKLMITTIEKEQNTSTVLSKLFTDVFTPSPLIAGRYLQKHYEDNNFSFEEAVQRVLYENINLNKSSKLMDEIVNLCVAPGNSPNIESIISYNFDDILEQRLEKIGDLGIQIPFKPIYGIGMNANGKLPIFHVHGFLPHKGKLTDNNKITFGELIYHRQYADIYSWNNIVQINKFRDFNCLFIGSSLTDPNIRRLLDIAKQQKGNNEESHFIFKMRHKEETIKQKLQNILNENKQMLDEKNIAELKFEETVRFLIDIIERFDESDTASFGVKTIWVNDWEEIPSMLKEIRQIS